MPREGFTWPVALQLFLTIILILVLSCRGCQDVERQTFTSFLDDSQVFSCNVSDTNLSAWIFIDEGCNIPHILSHGNTTYSQRHSLSLTRTGYHLQLSASLRDAGIYFCKENGQLKTSIELHVTVNGVIKVVVNTMTRIPCPVESITNTIWSFTMASDGKLTAIGTGSEIYPLHAAEYSVEVQNFSSSYTTSYLVFNATADKVGRIMTCQESGISRTNATLEIEVPLIVWLEVNGTKIEKETLKVYSNEYTTIVCNATGRRLPPGGLSWKLNNKKQKNEIEEGNNDNFTWSSFGFKPRDDDTSLSCTTNEQRQLPNVEISVKLNVLFPPKCYLDFRNESDDFSWTALCFCIGNPSVTKYELSHNEGAFQLTKELDFSTLDYPANITCRGTNSLTGSDTINKYIPKVVSAPTVMPISTRSSSKDDRSAGDNQTGILVLIIILIIVIVSLLCAMIFGCWKNRLRSVSLENTYFTGDQTSQTMATLSARPRLESPEIPRRIVNSIEESYEIVPMNQLQTDEAYQKPFSEESEYNETYFERASTSHQQNEYEVADDTIINTIDRRKVVSTVSSTSTFSDEEYFRHGDISLEGSTLKPQNKDTMSATKSKKDELRERKVKESVHWE